MLVTNKNKKSQSMYKYFHFRNFPDNALYTLIDFCDSGVEAVS